MRQSALFRARGGPNQPPSPHAAEETTENQEAEFQETLINPPHLEPTGRVLGQVRPIPETSASRPATLPPIRETVVVGGDAPLEPEPDEMEEEDEDLDLSTSSVPAPPAPPPVDEQILEEARRRAAQITSEAQQQARQMLEQTAAQTEAVARQTEEQARKQGYEAGYQEGRQEGLESAVREFADRIAQAKDMYVQIVRERRKVLADVEPQLVRLSVKVAERILGEELKLDPEAILGIVREALSGIKDREEITIRVHPDDVAVVTEHRTVFEKMVEGLKKFEVASDPTLDKGGCVIETNLGNVDARLATQLDAIRTGMEELARLREQELSNAVAAEPVEVPGDPDFQGLEGAAPPAVEADPPEVGQDEGGTDA